MKFIYILSVLPFVGILGFLLLLIEWLRLFSVCRSICFGWWYGWCLRPLF